MKDLKDLFVPCEIAKKLKEIGFEDICLGWYRNQGNLSFFNPRSIVGNNIDIQKFDDYTKAPTYEQVKLWFMEKHLIFITVNCEKWLSDFKGQVETSDAIIDTEMFHDYNEAFNAAIYAAIPFINKDNN